jgi:hypothetical protein
VSAADVCRLAQNLARKCGYACFPCGEDKRPMLKGWPERASTDPNTITKLWRHHAGPLIGIATGEASGIAVLDVDQKHAPARAWWLANYPRLLPTRTYGTRGGGLHLFYRHADGVKNSQGKLGAGIDTRGQGGYIIFWFAAGFGCFDHDPPAPWPAWMLAALTTPPPAETAPVQRRRPLPVLDDAALEGLRRRVGAAHEGERNAVLYWAACRCAERGFPILEAEALLLPAAAAAAAGVSAIEARRTIRSGMGRAAA